MTKRVHLVHWKAEELPERVRRLETAGYAVTAGAEEGGAEFRAIRRARPDAVVIDLGRLPSHGRHTAVALRDSKTTRTVPIVFVDGDPAKVARVRAALPDAVYTTWSRIRSGLRRALSSPPAEPITAPTDGGYSGTPLPKKLGITAGRTVALLAAPEGFDATLGTLPEGVRVRRQARGRCDVIVLFCPNRSRLEQRLPAAERALGEPGSLWVAWPKKASGVPTDLTGDGVRRIGLSTGLVDTKVCAIDATWSGLRFSRRRTPARKGPARR